MIPSCRHGFGQQSIGDELQTKLQLRDGGPMENDSKIALPPSTFFWLSEIRVLVRRCPMSLYCFT